MYKRYQQLIQKQSRVKIAVQAQKNSAINVRIVLLAAALASTFYFFSFFFGETLWRALTGG